MGICCSQDDSIDVGANSISHNNNSNQNSNIAQAPLLNNEVGSNNVYDISDIKIDDENNNNRNSIPITQPIEKISLTTPKMGLKANKTWLKKIQNWIERIFFTE